MTVPALTTTFTPSSSCTIDLYKQAYPGITCAIGSSLIPCDFYHLGVDSSTSDCFPPGWSDASTAYYSPGICPSGYTEACQSVVNSETRATCCPVGYQCQTETNWPWYSTDPCTFVMSTQQTFVYTTSIIGKGNVVSTVTAAEGLNAFGLQIRYQSTDFASSTSSSSFTSSTPKATGQTTGSGSSGPSPTGGSSGGSSNTSSGLSSGAKAGIGIGVALGALAFIGVALFLFIRKRRAAAAASAAGGGSGGASGSGGAMASMSSGPSSGGLGASTIGSPGSGVAYTAVSTGSPAPEQQKYYYAASNVATTPMVEAPGQMSWTPPVELPTEHQQYAQNQQPEYR
ncbi:hypothetical protein SBRCBS47491_005180 [Sporothrix bragantina]|uniref:Uncharacterized protein n=1 Tax=Sporothrix bragantina TaxID=671064 RepID=A0ABP0BWJ6_9PEZI